MNPSGLDAVLHRINELQQPPPAVARFANQLVQLAWTSAPAATATAAASSANTAFYETPTDPSTTMTPGPANASGTSGASGASSVSARRAVTPAVNRLSITPTTSTSAANLPAAAAPWRTAIDQAATAAGIDPNLLTALVWVESSFQPAAVSPAGAIGLAQLMPGTAKSLGVDPTNPVQNLQGSARMLRGLIDQFGRVDHALAAYNVGPNGLARGLAEGRTPGAGYARAVAEKYRTITGRELFT